MNNYEEVIEEYRKILLQYKKIEYANYIIYSQKLILFLQKINSMGFHTVYYIITNLLHIFYYT